MRTLLYIAIFLFLSCNNCAAQVDKPHQKEYYTTQDTVAIVVEAGDTLKYGKNEFNEIIDRHPELTDDYIENPDYDYHCAGDLEGFGGEAGQDSYYILYAYLLKNRNGDQKYAAIRGKLIDIYSNINALFGYFEHGGTYFGHQYARIHGYAEYSVYLYKLNESRRISKTYSIARQKELYIKSLRQLISDESSIDFDFLGQEKTERIKKLNKIVDDIEKAITNNFFLRRAQEFHYGHYEYY